jgi:hypothetical protein
MANSFGIVFLNFMLEGCWLRGLFGIVRSKGLTSAMSYVQVPEGAECIKGNFYLEKTADAPVYRDVI